jgi:hypothetical protein
VALGGVADDVADLVLRVVAAVPADGRLAAEAAEARQARVRPDLEAPAVAVDKVPVEDVQFVERHQVQVALDGVHVQEVPRDVGHQAAPAEARRVVDRHGGQRPPDALDLRRREDIRWQELADGLDAVEGARRAHGEDRDPFGRDAQVVAFAAEPRHRPVGAGRVDPYAAVGILASRYL